MGASKNTSNGGITKKGPTKTGEKRIRRLNKKETFSVYIYKVLKQVHQDTGITKRSMSVMNSFIYDLFERITIEASKLVRYSKKQTLSAREIQSSVKLLLPGELAKHAILEGNKAMNNFVKSS